MLQQRKYFFYNNFIKLLYLKKKKINFNYFFLFNYKNYTKKQIKYSSFTFFSYKFKKKKTIQIKKIYNIVSRRRHHHRRHFLKKIKNFCLFQQKIKRKNVIIQKYGTFLKFFK